MNFTKLNTLVKQQRYLALMTELRALEAQDDILQNIRPKGLLDQIRLVSKLTSVHFQYWRVTKKLSAHPQYIKR